MSEKWHGERRFSPSGRVRGSSCCRTGDSVLSTRVSSPELNRRRGRGFALLETDEGPRALSICSSGHAGNGAELVGEGCRRSVEIPTEPRIGNAVILSMLQNNGKLELLQAVESRIRTGQRLLVEQEVRVQRLRTLGLDPRSSMNLLRQFKASLDLLAYTRLSFLREIHGKLRT